MDRRIESHRWLYEIQKDRLIASHAGVVQMQLALAPRIEGETTTVVAWSEPEPGHFVAALDRGGSVHLAIDCGHVCYWMETDVEQFETLTYFPGMTFNGRYWQTYTSDEHDRRWDVDTDQEVGISSAYGGESPFHQGWLGGGMTDPGDEPPYWIWNIPVRACSFQTRAGWVGFSMPGALPVGLVRLRMERGMFSLNFDVLRPSCREGAMPRVYIVTGIADPYDLLDEHRIISDNLGLTAKKSATHPSWWTNPEYNYWDEYSRLRRQSRERGEEENPITAKGYLEWLNTTRELVGIREMNITLEQGCYNYYGDYTPVDGLGGVGGVRKLVDDLRQEGARVGHYIHPYMVNTRCSFWKEHPEAFCKPKNNVDRSLWPLEDNDERAEMRQLDWTHPLARDFIEERIRFLYSDEPGCLNCDIVRSNNWLSPDPRFYDFHDPDWGIGDLMTCKVQRFIYETAKRIKPDCMVSKVSPGDPYLQPWTDACYLCEEWNSTTDNWYRRGRIATRVMREVVFLTDCYFVTLTKGYEFYMGMLAWNYPTTCAVRHAIHPYTHYREMEGKDFRRRKAGFHAAMNAPLRIGDLSRVNVLEGGEVEQWRKRTVGRLAGFYAALALGKRTLVTYSETEVRIATSITRTVEFPLPPGANLRKVEMVPHEGEPEEWACEVVETSEGTGLRMHVEDSGLRALYYRVRHALRA